MQTGTYQEFGHEAGASALSLAGVFEFERDAMPRYFFHIHDGKEFRDRDGTVLDDEVAARAQALATAGSMLREKGETFWDGTEWRMTVVNEAGQTICDLRFSARCTSGPDHC